MVVGAPEIMAVPVLGGAHDVTTAGTADLPGEQSHRSDLEGLCFLGDHGLDAVPQGVVNDGLVGSLHAIPLALGAGLVLPATGC